MGSILVIDDDPHIRELVAVLLDRAGFTSTSAADGREGLRALGDAQIDLCIVDAMMPNLDGVEFCRAARGFEAGADDYLVKPFDAQELRPCSPRRSSPARRHHSARDGGRRAGRTHGNPH
jgi:DNA-binding response OmpR family regulator